MKVRFKVDYFYKENYRLIRANEIATIENVIYDKGSEYRQRSIIVTCMNNKEDLDDNDDGHIEVPLELITNPLFCEIIEE